MWSSRKKANTDSCGGGDKTTRFLLCTQAAGSLVFGRAQATREKLQKELDDMKKRYVLMNDARNPFKNAEF